MKKQKVYLAGGFRTNWQELVKDSSENIYWINPKDKEFKNEERVVMDVREYAKWDLHFIKQCDILFAYVERTNTSCIGLCCEVGYAKGLGKTVILVLEENHETIKDSYLKFLNESYAKNQNLNSGSICTKRLFPKNFKSY